jgi:C-terminal processing protease CtpA/Prc
MSAPRVLAVAPGSPASRAGIEVGDEIVTVDGEVPAGHHPVELAHR